jgi:hypothetical protein
VPQYAGTGALSIAEEAARVKHDLGASSTNEG